LALKEIYQIDHDIGILVAQPPTALSFLQMMALLEKRIQLTEGTCMVKPLAEMMDLFNAPKSQSALILRTRNLVLHSIPGGEDQLRENWESVVAFFRTHVLEKGYIECQSHEEFVGGVVDDLYGFLNHGEPLFGLAAGSVHEGASGEVVFETEVGSFLGMVVASFKLTKAESTDDPDIALCIDVLLQNVRERDFVGGVLIIRGRLIEATSVDGIPVLVVGWESGRQKLTDWIVNSVRRVKSRRDWKWAQQGFPKLKFLALEMIRLLQEYLYTKGSPMSDFRKIVRRELGNLPLDTLVSLDIENPGVFYFLGLDSRISTWRKLPPKDARRELDRLQMRLEPCRMKRLLNWLIRGSSSAESRTKRADGTSPALFSAVGTE